MIRSRAALAASANGSYHFIHRTLLGARLTELAILVGVIAVAFLVVRTAYRPVVALVRTSETLLLWVAILTILGVMFFVTAEVVMRYGYNSPIPGHLELSELLLLAIVFLAISYTQRTHGHVGMDLLLDALSPSWRRRADILTLIVSIFVCAVVGWFSTKLTYQMWLYDDVTMTDPYFKTWPWAATIAFGYVQISLRMMVQLMTRLDPERFPDDTPADETGLHQASE